MHKIRDDGFVIGKTMISNFLLLFLYSIPGEKEKKKKVALQKFLKEKKVEQVKKTKLFSTFHLFLPPRCELIDS